MTSILGPRGTPYVDLSSDRAWKTRVHGDIVASFQWLKVDGEDDPHPCLCLYSASRRMETGAYAIRQKSAHWFADNRGNPTKELLTTAMEAAQQMGFDLGDRSAAFKVISVIVDAIPDLIAMPSDQPGALAIKRAIHGIEGRVTMNGKTVHEEVI